MIDLISEAIKLSPGWLTISALFYVVAVIAFLKWVASLEGK